MTRRVVAIVAIFLACTGAWLVLGGAIHVRTHQARTELNPEVSALWGPPQVQLSPTVVFRHEELRAVTELVKDESGTSVPVTREKPIQVEDEVLLDGSDVSVDLALDERRRGLLWHSTYAVRFDGRYRYVHRSEREGEVVIVWRLPAREASYESVVFEVAGTSDRTLVPRSDERGQYVQHVVPVVPGAEIPFRIAYDSRGQDDWRYAFGGDVARVNDFSLVMTTDFEAIDFPAGTISPTTKERIDGGWRLAWDVETLISGLEIGMDLPERLQPGPLAARIALFAPVSLLFFFVWLFVITLLRDVPLHPMNYLFLAAAFFAFHLLFAYTVDHVPVVPAFLLASGVSVFLVVSYLRVVVGLRFAAVEAGLSQLVYLVLFSWAQFFEGWTGLMVTVGSILTLFVLMQLTARLDWFEVFSRPRPEAA